MLVPPQLKKPELITPGAVNQRGFARAVTPHKCYDVISSESFLISLNEKHAVCNGSIKKKSAEDC